MKNTRLKFTMEMKLQHIKDFLISLCGWALLFAVAGIVLCSFLLIGCIISEGVSLWYLIIFPFFWAFLAKLSGIAIDWMEY